MYHEGNDRHLDILHNASRRQLVKEYFNRALELSNRNGKGMIAGTSLCGGGGLGKSLIAQAVGQLIPQFFSNVKCIYIPLNGIQKEMALNLQDIIEYFFPQLDKSEHVMVLLMKFILHIKKEFSMISNAGKFIGSVSGCLNTGVLINFVEHQ